MGGKGRAGLSVAFVAMASLVVAGCGIAGSPSAGDSPSPGSSAGPSTGSSTAPSAAPSEGASAPASAPAGALCAVEFEGCPIPSGTYTTDAFTHPFTFTLEGDDWINDRDWPHGGSVTKGASSAFLWASGVTEGLVDGQIVEIGPTPADFVEHLGRFEGFTVSAATPVTIDGVDGFSVDVTTNESGAPGLFALPEDQFNLAPGEKARFIVLDKDGQTVILMVDAFEEGDFDSFATEVAQPILDGLTWQ
jgi:hypothetical protein